jgi:uncharacterized protein (TIGR02270 family)
MGILSPDEVQSWLKELAQNPNRKRELVAACGAAGDPVYVPWLIKQMTTEPELARIAGESFSHITGADIAYEDLEADWPQGFQAGPTENPEDEDVSLDPDEDLRWPEAERIQEWWDANKHRFRPGARYLVGKPVTDQHCREVLRSGMQRQRLAAALELALADPALPLFETRAPGLRQRQLLSTP